MTFTDAIRAIRGDWSQEEAARLLGHTQAWWSRIENGEREPGLADLYLLSQLGLRLYNGEWRAEPHLLTGEAVIERAEALVDAWRHGSAVSTGEVIAYIEGLLRADPTVEIARLRESNQNHRQAYELKIDDLRRETLRCSALQKMLDAERAAVTELWEIVDEFRSRAGETNT